ncbi:MAG: porin [Rhodocyclaceae bacterium]|nr:porin [Rhodocyclaceae bacterium]
MRFAATVLACLLASFVQAEEFKFDAAEFEKKSFEFGGYLELKADRAWLNRDGSFYKLNGLDRSTLDRNTSTLKLNAKYTQGIATFKLRADAEVRRDDLSSERIERFDEAYVSFKPDPGFTLDIGKMAMKWGKGYAWNPVGFVERAKDPNDVELAREGYTMVAADFIRNFDGDLKTVAFTPVLLPVGNQSNSDFGAPNHLNAAAKLYLLYCDTDIDFTWLGGGSRSSRFGIDFSRNLTSALEIHGEWARIRDFELRRIDAAGNVSTATRAATSYLLGLRYLTENDTTWIAEYYRNGTGYTESQLTDFHALVDSGNPLLFNKAWQISPSYGRANAGERYFYLRASQKEPFDIVYFTPSATVIANLDDGSYSLTPELLYTGITNLDLRLRATWLKGGSGTEFGEKQTARKLELMARFYF